MPIARASLGACLAACYAPPSLPPFDGVPLESRPFEPCAVEQSHVLVGCVIDGDTFDVGNCGGERVRMLGIDAPETEGPDGVPECFAEEATRWLAVHIDGERVSLSFDRDCTGSFGRTLAYVWLRGDALEEVAQEPDLQPFVWAWPPDPTEPALLLNEALLGLGYARGYPEEWSGSLQFQDRLDRASGSARMRMRGLWGVCDSDG